MALPRPGKVNPVAQAAATTPETLPELDQAAAADEAPSLGMPPLQAEAQVSPAFGTQPGAGAPPFNTSEELPPEMTLVDPVQTAEERTVLESPTTQVLEQPAAEHAQPQRRVTEAECTGLDVPGQTLPPAQGQPQMQPPVQAQMQPPVQAAPAVDHRAMMGAGGQQALAEMGFEGLDGGFGDFPTIKLQEGQFQTSEGDMMGQKFACVIHSSEAKYIMKSGAGEEAEFKYTKDKRTDTSGVSLEETLKVWRAKGVLAPDAQPIFKAYADVTVQLFDVAAKELGAVVLLSIPETSIGRVRGYMKTLVIAEGLHPNQVITQVYMAPKVTSVKHPFHPWGMKKWALVSDFGL